jgi:hypothetical protein
MAKKQSNLLGKCFIINNSGNPIEYCLVFLVLDKFEGVHNCIWVAGRGSFNFPSIRKIDYVNLQGYIDTNFATEIPREEFNKKFDESIDLLNSFVVKTK